MGLAPGEETVYSKLNKLLHQGELKRFVDARSEFSWQPKGQKGMLIIWGAGAAPSSASAPATAEPAECANASGTAPASGSTPVSASALLAPEEEDTSGHTFFSLLDS